MSFYNTNLIANQVTQSQQQQIAFLRVANTFVSSQARKVYYSGNTEEEAEAFATTWIKALGKNAVTQFTISQILVTALNQIALITGEQPIGDIMPENATFVPSPNNDGSGSLVFATTSTTTSTTTMTTFPTTPMHMR